MLADLKLSGRYAMAEPTEIRGILPLMKMLLDGGLLHGDCFTVTGKTLAGKLADVRPYSEAQEMIHSLDNPTRKDSRLIILKGDLAPKGAVAKITGKEGLSFMGEA
jgi:dihydroxy-acid dehydratase